MSIVQKRTVIGRGSNGTVKVMLEIATNNLLLEEAQVAATQLADDIMQAVCTATYISVPLSKIKVTG